MERIDLAMYDASDPKSAAGVAKAIRDGECSAQDVVREAVANLEVAAPCNATITIDADGAIGAAGQLDARRGSQQPSGRLAGVPLVVKENIHVAGLPNTASSPALRKDRRRIVERNCRGPWATSGTNRVGNGHGRIDPATDRTKRLCRTPAHSRSVSARRHHTSFALARHGWSDGR